MSPVWWQADQDCWLTNWPAPPEWQGAQFRVDPDGGVQPLAGADPADPAAAEAPREDWARTLSQAEAEGLDRADEAAAARRAERIELYRRAAFGLATAAELASLDAAEAAAAGAGAGGTGTGFSAP